MLTSLVLLILCSEATCLDAEISNTDGNGLGKVDMVDMLGKKDMVDKVSLRSHNNDVGIRVKLSEAAEEFKAGLQPGFTVLLSALTIWSILKLLAKSISLLTASENIKANFLNFLHEGFKMVVIVAIETGFYDNLNRSYIRFKAPICE